MYSLEVGERETVRSGKCRSGLRVLLNPLEMIIYGPCF